MKLKFLMILGMIFLIIPLINSTWFDFDYSYSRIININNTNSLQNATINYTVSFTLDTATLVSDGKLNANCSDLHIIYGDSVDLTAQNKTFIEKCNDTSSEIYFPLQAQLNISINNSDYKVYYGNPSEGIIYGSEYAFIFLDTAEFGTLTDKWTRQDGAVSNYNTTISYDGSKSILLSKFSSATNQKISASITAQKDIILEYWINDTNETTTGHAHYMTAKTAGSTSAALGVITATSTPGYSLLKTGGWLGLTALQRAGGWQKLGVGIMANETIIAIMNGTATHTDYRYAAGDVTAMWFLNEDGAGVGNKRMYVDNVRIRKWIYPEPTVTLDAEINSMGFAENSQTYNSSIYETELGYFEINLTYESSKYDSISASLIYNDTSYTGTKSGTGDTIIFTKNLIAPKANASSQDFNFYWEISLINSTGTFKFNATSKTQTINRILLGACSGAVITPILNFTLYDEQNLTKLGSWDFKGTFEYWIGDGSIKKNASVENLNDFETLICIDTNISYKINAIIEYSFDSNYVIRNYYYEDKSVSNATEEVYLYSLKSADSTTFILQVQNQNQLKVSDALIYIDRYYPEDNTYRTVQIAKTDINGKSIGFFEVESALYRFQIIKDGKTKLITSKQKVSKEDTPYTLLFTIGIPYEKPWADFDDLDNLDYSLTWDNTTKIVTYIYTDNSDNFSQGRLLVVKLFHNMSSLIICNLTSSDSSAVLECDVSGYNGTFQVQGFILRTGDDEKTISLLIFIISEARSIFGLTGVILGWFIILVSGFAFIWHPIAGIVGIDSAVIFVNLIGLITFSPLFIFGMLTISVILIFIIKE